MKFTFEIVQFFLGVLEVWRNKHIENIKTKP